MRGAPPCKCQRPFLDYPHWWLSQHGSRPYGVLSAFLVSCRCRGKHTTLDFIPFAPHHPCCLLLKISYSHHCIWLPTNNSLNSVKNPFGELIFFIKNTASGYFSLYMHKYVYMYRRGYVYMEGTHSSRKNWVGIC